MSTLSGTSMDSEDICNSCRRINALEAATSGIYRIYSLEGGAGATPTIRKMKGDLSGYDADVGPVVDGWYYGLEYSGDKLYCLQGIAGSPPTYIVRRYATDGTLEQTYATQTLAAGEGLFSLYHDGSVWWSVKRWTDATTYKQKIVKLDPSDNFSISAEYDIGLPTASTADIITGHVTGFDDGYLWVESAVTSTPATRYWHRSQVVGGTPQAASSYSYSYNSPDIYNGPIHGNADTSVFYMASGLISGGDPKLVKVSDVSGTITEGSRYDMDVIARAVTGASESGGLSQTEWYRYPTTTTSVSLGTPDGGVSIPELDCIGCDSKSIFTNQNILDMRVALQALAPYYENADTGSPFTWTGGDPDNLYFKALGDRSQWGATGGAKYDWTRDSAAMVTDPNPYDIDFGEITDVLDKLEASALV